MTVDTGRPHDLRIGSVHVDVPMELAPMAGVTNMPFRLLCREFGPGGLYVCEMVTCRPLVEGQKDETFRLLEQHPSEHPRSVQLYGVDPAIVAAAVAIILDRDLADHIDLNFGCPVPKVTRKGGGAALPWKTGLFKDIVGRAVEVAGKYDVPVTVKMRTGIDDDHMTFIEAGLAAEQVGAAAITLHARTAAEHYSGNAHWEKIAQLKSEIHSIPVLGNGDVWSGHDAVDMMRQTGCDGVVVGRGAQGRPWIFAEIKAALEGRDEHVNPNLGHVADVILRHAELMVDYFHSEKKACREIRHHIAWYLKGYPVGGELRRDLGLVESLVDLDTKLARLDRDAPYPGSAAEGRRGRAGNPKHPTLPYGWLDSRDIDTAAAEELKDAELDVSGG